MKENQIFGLYWSDHSHFWFLWCILGSVLAFKQRTRLAEASKILMISFVFEILFKNFLILSTWDLGLWINLALYLKKI